VAPKFGIVSPTVAGLPDFDAWLGHLRRDRRGLPVPYVNLWGEQTVDNTTVRYDQHVGMDAVFVDDRDETVPDFTRQNLQRQRFCMVTGLCQVCARSVPWSRRNLALSTMSIELIDMVEIPGRKVPVVHEPWLCDRCAAIATQACPALIRRARDERLTIHPIRSKTQVRLVTSSGWVEGPLAEQTKRHPAAMWVKVMILTAPSRGRTR
jgi:hypothetical protein